MFSYSLTTKGNSNSSARVTLWRRLQRLGAISLTSGIYVLPNNEQCLESFQWLAQEIRNSKGEAYVLHVDQLEGLTDSQVVELFHEARRDDYEALGSDIEKLSKRASKPGDEKKQSVLTEKLVKLQRRFEEISAIDYFGSPEGLQASEELHILESSLVPADKESNKIPSLKAADFKKKTWLTRPKPHVDRLACAWLIRRFIDPKAEIRYGKQVKSSEIPFDMDVGEFTHVGNLCTFEMMIRAFQLKDPALKKLAEIVHEIDLNDGRYFHSEIAGINSLLNGWREIEQNDVEREAQGCALFEGLYQSLSKKAAKKEIS